MKKRMKKLLVLFMTAILTLSSLFLTPVTSSADETSIIPSNKISSTFEFFVGNSTFFYDDAYFNTPASEYNHSFATTSLCLAMSAFNYPDSGYNHGYRCAEDMMQKMGFSNIKANDFYNQKPNSDTMGAVIGSKEVTKSDGTVQPIIVMALRGGNYESEWAGNVTIGEGTAEHKGFSDARDIAASYLNDYLKDVKDKYSQSGYAAPKIWIVGYSRASATANLTGCFINCALAGEGTWSSVYDEMQNSLRTMNVSTDDVYVYCFEVPQGLTNDSKYYPTDQSNIWCIVNPADPVPDVAPSAMGFKRAGTDVDPTEGVSYDAFMDQMNQINRRMAAEWAASEAQTNFQAYSSNIINLIGVVMGGDFNKASSSYVGNNSAEFCRKLVNEFLVPAIEHMHSKFFELKGKTAREIYIGYLQQPIQIIAKALMGSSSKDQKVLTDALSKAVSNNIDFWTKASFIGALDDLLYGGQGGTKLVSIIQGILNGIIKDLSKDDGVSKIISKSDMQVLKDGTYYLSALVASMYVDDIFSYQYIATAKTYAADLFLPHYPEYVLAYMRAGDQNYPNVDLEQYQLEIKRTNTNSSLENIEILIYYVDDYNHYDEVVASFRMDEGLKHDYENSGTFWDGGSAYSSEDKISLYVNRAAMDNDQDYRFEIRDLSEDGSTQNIILDYNIIKNGDGNNKKTEYYENTAIPIRKGDCFKITPKKSDRSYANFEKYITLTPVFVNENLEEIAAGTMTMWGGEKGSEKKERYDEGPILVAQKHRFDITPADGTFFTELLIPAYDETGKVVVDDEREIVQTRHIDNPVTWDIYESSMPLYIVCNEKYADGQVYADILHQYYKNGSTTKMTDEMLTTIPITVKNLTEGTEKIDTGALTIDAEPGDEIEVSFNENDIPNGFVFNGWSLKTAKDVEKSEDGTKLTFTMTEGGAEVHGMLGDPADDITLTFTGMWAHPKKNKPGELYWKQIYIDPAYTEISYKDASNYYPTKHVYKRAFGYKAPMKAWIQAPGYYSEDCGDMVFDHWEAYYTDSGNRVTDRIAVETYYNSSTGKYETQYVNPNGVTEEILVLENIEKSITVVPAYEPAEYEIHFHTSAGSTRTIKAKAGEKVTLEDNGVVGYQIDEISGYYNPLKETADKYGNVTRSFDETVVIGLEGTASLGIKGTFEFIMPKGDVYVESISNPADYEVIWTGDAIKTSSGEKFFHMNETVTVVPDIIPHSAHLTDITVVSGLEDTSSIELVKDVNGDVLSMTFKMEDSDVVLDYTLESYSDYNLKLINATAEYADGTEIISLPEDNYTVYENDIIVLNAAIPDGYYLKGWKVTPKDGVEIILSENLSTAYIQMPDMDLTIEAELGEYKEITQIDLDFPSTFAGNQLTPESACVTAGGEQVQEELVAVEQVADPIYENSMIFGFPYEFEFILTPEDGYYFGDNTKVSLHGAECTMTFKDDGTISFHCMIATGPAHITVIEPVSGLEGLPSGITLDAIKAKAPKVTQAFVEERSSWITPGIMLDWDNLENAAGEPYTFVEDTDEAQDFYVPVTGLDFSSYTQGPEYYDENSLVINPGVTYNNRIHVSILAADIVSLPYVSNDRLPGTYSENVTVGLACDTEDADIYYQIDEPGKTYTAVEILTNGDLYADTISLIGEEGVVKNYTIYAVAAVDGEEIKYSDVAAFAYTIDIPKIEYFDLTVVNGSGSGSYPFDDKTVVGVRANEPEGNVVFTKFEVKEGTVTPIFGGLNKNFLTFYMPESNVTLVANYEITKLEYTVQNPVAGENLSGDVFSNADNAEAAELVEKANGYISYYDESGEEQTGTADYETTYTGKFIVAALPEGFAFAEDLSITVNGEEADVVPNSDGSLDVTYVFQKTDARIYTLEVINGTAYDAESGEELPVFGGVSELYADDCVRIKADKIEGKVFAGWEEPTGVLSLDSGTAEFFMPSQDVTLTAIYKDLVTKIDLTMNEPASPDWILAGKANVETGGLEGPTARATWTRNNEPVFEVDAEGKYLVSLEVIASEGFILSEDAEAFLNGKPCRITVLDDGERAVICMEFEAGEQKEDPVDPVDPEKPDTGDHSNPLLYIIILLVCLILGLFAVIFWRKNKKK